MCVASDPCADSVIAEGEALAALEQGVDPLGLLGLGAVVQHQQQPHVVAHDGVLVLQVVVEPEPLGGEVLPDDRHPEVASALAAVLLGIGVAIVAGRVGAAPRLGEQLLPLLVGEPTSVPVGALVLAPMIEEADVVVGLLEGLDLPLDEFVQLFQVIGQLGRNLEVHRISSGGVTWLGVRSGR